MYSFTDNDKLHYSDKMCFIISSKIVKYHFRQGKQQIMCSNAIYGGIFLASFLVTGESETATYGVT